MCGRFARFSIKPVIIEEFGVEEIGIDFEQEYNITPGNNVISVIGGEKRRLTSFKWGLVPSWSKDPSIGNKMINARSETISEKPSFRNAFKKRRCLVIADGFYEWQKREKSKYPFYISLKSSKPFGFAGLNERWTSPSGEELNTCTIITCQPNSLLLSIHNRMPVIVKKEDEDLWLNCENSEDSRINDILKPYDSDLLEAFEVSKFVNSPANNSPDCIKPFEG